MQEGILEGIQEMRRHHAAIDYLKGAKHESSGETENRS